MSSFCGVITESRDNLEYKKAVSAITFVKSKTFSDTKIFNQAIFAFYTNFNTSKIPFSSPILKKENKLFLSDSRLDNRDELISLLGKNAQCSDANILLSAYEKWGKNCLQYIIGDFAFIIWDIDNQEVFCVRDRLGIKPLYYALNRNSFYFSSDISTIFKLSFIEKKPDIPMMKSFLHYSEVDSECTLFKNIKRLPAGHYLLVRNNKVKVSRYWYPEKIEINKKISFEVASTKFKELLTAAVNVRLESTVPVSAELSGGLDSTSVTCIAEKNREDSLKEIYSLRFGTYNCDEGPFINAVSKNLSKEHVTIRADHLDYTNQYNMDFNYKIHRDWPLMGASIHLYPMVEEMHSRGTHVVLTGQGGDHILTGNRDMLADYLRSFSWRKLYKSLKHYKFSKRVIKQNVILPFFTYLSSNQKRRIKSILVFIGLYSVEWINKKQSHKNILCNPKQKSFAFCRDLDYVTDNLYLTWNDANIYHAFELEYGIEFRHPFLDIRLVEFMLSLPAEFKLNEGITKSVLRNAMKGIIPELVRLRNDKAEYSQLLLDQINAIDLKSLWSNSMLIKLDIVPVERLTEMMNQYQEGKLKQIVLFWRMINLEYWYRVNFLESY